MPVTAHDDVTFVKNQLGRDWHLDGLNVRIGAGQEVLAV